jgi:hypothetical protein
MPRYKMIVMSRPTEGREDEYNDWYQNVHLRELVALPGFQAAQRYRIAASLVEGEAHPYLAVYELETDDIDATLQGLRDAAGSAAIAMSDALDTESTFAVIYEEFGEKVSAP